MAARHPKLKLGRVEVYVLAVCSAWVAFLILSLADQGLSAPERILLLALVLGIAESAEVVYHHRGRIAAIGLGDALLPVMYLTLSLPGAIVANAVGIIGMQIVQRKPPLRAIFNATQIGISAGTGWLVFDLIRGDAGVLSVRTLAAVVAAGIIFSTMSHVFTSLVLWFHGGVGFGRLLSGPVTVLGLHLLTTLSLGILFALATVNAWWVAVFFVPVLLILARGFRALLREAGQAERLKHLNEALHHLAAATELEATYVPVLQAAAAATRSDRAGLLLVEGDVARYWEVGRPEGPLHLEEATEAQRSLLGVVGEGGGVVLRDGGALDPASLEATELAVVPVAHARGALLGAMAVFDRSGSDAYGSSDLQLLEGLAAELAATILSEITRARLQGELDEARRLESLGRLSGGIAHDFNNLLAIVINYSELLLKEPGMPGDQRKDVRAILDAGKRGARMVKQLLAFSRKDVVRPQEVRLAETVIDIEGLLQRVAGSEIDLRIVVEADDIPSIQIDPVGLEQVLMNLVVNARDALRGSGTIEVRLGKIDDHARISVSDNGHGMDPNTAERVFEPFFTTKSRAEGTGLGLSTVYGIVKQAGGEITVESEPGHGTRFHILLPACETEKHPSS